MNERSTITTVTGSAHHVSLRSVASAIGGRAAARTCPRWSRSTSRIITPPLNNPSTPRVVFLAVLIEVAAVTVIEHDRGESLDLEPPDRFGPQVFVRHDFGLL